jgi:hypothetical protein
MRITAFEAAGPARAAVFVLRAISIYEYMTTALAHGTRVRRIVTIIAASAAWPALECEHVDNREPECYSPPDLRNA